MPNTIASFFSFSPATKARASEVNVNFSNFRGALIPINSDTVTASNNTHDLGSSEYVWNSIYLNGLYESQNKSTFLPTGSIIPTTRLTLPAHGLLCDGSSISRSTYSDLFGILSNGASTSPCFGYETTTHFNLPDLRGKFIRGVDAGAGNDPDSSSRTAQGSSGYTGDTLGSIQGFATGTPVNTITTNSTGNHTHQLPIMTDVTESTFAMVSADTPTTTTDRTSSEGDHTHTLTTAYSDTRPKNLNLYYYIIY